MSNCFMVYSYLIFSLFAFFCLDSHAVSTVLTNDRLIPTPIQIRLSDLPKPHATNSAHKFPFTVPVPNDATLNVPPGFEVNVFAEGLKSPRWLALTPTNEVLVTETRENRIRLLKDLNNDGIADHNETFADASNGLNIPFGMTFCYDFDEREYYFVLGNTDAVRKYRYKIWSTNITGPGQKIHDLPGYGYNQHWTRNVIRTPYWDRIYVSVGSESNNDVESLPRASVMEMDLDGQNVKTVAFGLRNPVGLAVHPYTYELYTTVNERDGLGDDLVPDYFTRIRNNEFYGWPLTYLSSENVDPRHKLQDGRSINETLANLTKTPDVLFQAHSAALGLQFYPSYKQRFPSKYHNGAFVVFRGSWNRKSGTGYKIVFVPFGSDNRPLGYYEDFLTGFLVDPTGPTTWGRPVGLLVTNDGDLLFTEEHNNRIYRVTYKG